MFNLDRTSIILSALSFHLKWSAHYFVYIGTAFEQSVLRKSGVRDMDYTLFSTQQIAMLFEKADKEVKQALLAGSDWKDISDKRYRYTELPIALHKRYNPEDFGYRTPADRPSRYH